MPSKNFWTSDQRDIHFSTEFLCSMSGANGARGAVSKKRADTVGELPSAENCASHMPSLKAQEQGASEVATAALLRCNRFANSIRAVSVQRERSMAIKK